MKRRAAGFPALLLLLAFAPPAQGDPAGDPLAASFRDPPQSARPLVWWHWMNGNVTAEGARLDLEWMKRAGIGGVQLFEGNVATPQLVQQRLVYMSPEWRHAFRTSVETATRLGLDVTLTTSPGWSATGGPWVAPEAAMKKLVWSEIEVEGERRFRGVVPQPSDVAGPYQDIPVSAIETGQGEGPAFYRDAAVFAYPIPVERAPHPVRITSSSGALDGAGLVDRRFAAPVLLPFGPDGNAWLEQDLGATVPIGSVVVGLPGPRGFGAPPPPLARMEASVDGRAWFPVAELPASRSPVRSAAFAPVRARHVRLVLSSAGKGGMPPAPPGVLMPKFPSPPESYAVSEFRVSGEPRVHRAEEKAGFATVADYYAVDTLPAAASEAPAPSRVVDLTARMRSDGQLDWTPGKGRWRIVRLGYSLTGHHNGPAPKEATGLEVDKLSARHLRAYLDTYLGLYRETLGRFGGRPGSRGGVTSLLSDSIESGPQNWTDEMMAQFERRRGYSPRPWLPVLTGAVIGSAAESDNFLWDFRRTIAELLADNHYGEIARTAHQNGLSYFAEALEDHRPQLGDDMAMRRHADVPMGAMWMFPAGSAPNPTYVADLRGAASVAHVYGKSDVAAESLTAFAQPWSFAPRHLKSTIDLAFALGVTRPIIHTSPHQPFTDDRKPGLALAVTLGQYFSRNETWAEQARAWTDYLARSSFLLRQGRHHADIAYFYGEEAPITALYGDAAVADVPDGYGFDFIDAGALLNHVRVESGALITEGGARYRLLLLGGSSRRMTLAMLRRLAVLAEEGATIAGPRPTGSPSLADDPAAVEALIARLWDGGFVRARPEEALAAARFEPDWSVAGGEGDVAILHRRLDDGDIYFVSNRRDEARTLDIRFRVTGKAAELWRADSGRSESLSYRIEQGRTHVPLALEAGDAAFVVFRKPAEGNGRSVPAARTETLATLAGPWQVSFEGLAAPAARRFASLSSWSEAAATDLRYFSGSATYARTIDVPDAWLSRGGSLLLDLGDVRELAEISINGRVAGQLWKPPFRIDIAPYLKPGRNRLEIKVTNLWVNRLIGDAQPGADRRAYTQEPAYAPDAPLRPSGLIGPVRLLGQARGALP